MIAEPPTSALSVFESERIRCPEWKLFTISSQKKVVLWIQEDNPVFDGKHGEGANPHLCKAPFSFPHLRLSSAGPLPSDTSFFLTLSASSSLSWTVFSRMEGIEITHRLQFPEDDNPARGVTFLEDTLTAATCFAAELHNPYKSIKT